MVAIEVGKETPILRKVPLVQITDWFDPLLDLSAEQVAQLKKDLLSKQALGARASPGDPGYSLRNILRQSLFQNNLVELEALLGQMHGQDDDYRVGTLINFAHDSQSELLQGEILAHNGEPLYDRATQTIQVRPLTADDWVDMQQGRKTQSSFEPLTVSVVAITQWVDLTMMTGDERSLGAAGDYLSKAAAIAIFETQHEEADWIQSSESHEARVNWPKYGYVMSEGHKGHLKSHGKKVTSERQMKAIAIHEAMKAAKTGKH
jgi:hypothetical protein